MTDTRTSSIWSKIPILLPALIDCIAKKLSASEAAKILSWVAGQPLSRNSMISAAKRRGMSFDSENVGQYPRKLKAKRQVVCNIRRVKQPSIPLPAEPLIEPDFLGLSLLELDRDQCKFAHGDGPWTFCGQPVWDETSYCSVHYRITHQGYSKGY